MAADRASNGALRAVFFDLDDTLRESVPHPHDAYVSFLTKKGLNLSEATRKAAYRWAHSYWANSTALLDDYEKHKGYDDPFWQNYTRRHLRAFELTEEQIETLAPAVHSYMGNDYRPASRLVPGTMDLLRDLRARGYFVGLLTNRSRPIYQEMTELGLDHFLDLYLTAGQMDIFKPAADFFTQPLAMLNLKATEVVYVGDNLYADILGASNASITSILIDPRDLYPNHDGLRIRELSQILDILEPAAPPS